MLTTAMLLGLAWKSVVVAGLTLGLLRLARWRSAGERSMIAHAGLAALLALPAAILLLPQWTPLPASWSFEAAAPVVQTATTKGAAIDPTPAATSVPVVADSVGSTPIAFPWSDLAPFLYLIPLALLSGMMTLAVVRLFAMRGRAEILVEGSWLSALAEAQRRMGFKHGTALLVSKELRSPISWGVLRPTIVLSPKAVAASGEAEAIIAHELAHVARLDWAKLLGARVACAVFWFNPLVWMLARESHQLREEAADDAVLMADINGPDYATLLVGAARHDNQGALLAAHGVAPGKDSLKRRITRVLDGSLKRGPASASWILMSLVVLAGVTAPLAAFSATARPAATADVHSVVASTAKETTTVTSRSASAAKALATEDAATAAATAKTLSAEQLVSMRAVGVTPEYIEKIRESGGSMDADDIISAKASGIDPAYIRQMREVIPGADFDELVGARHVGVNAAFARDMKSHFPDIGVDDLIALKAMGVDCDFVTDMQKSGVRMRDADDAIELRATSGFRPVKPRPAAAPRPVAKAVRNGNVAVVDMERGVIEARRADGRTARVEFPAAPEPPEPPVRD
ncbi:MULTISPECIES: M56 family metallopeptidase [unclassified Sphingopyxis]|jgi:beta-lactamase regulating signal transducer with metallopeptidase domain|uniref:M56 family metallopeptidase n=1 Tax=unclassified Sphingopyxis TaxID=2614943 RepID=UPI0006C0EFEC|nr:MULTISPECIES: M56 family metallopeptidase [unclassified Sphingopyxis]USI76354.1 M56 family metallopeptidase [Sphingopyxis sp. USTB-05]GAO76912.1 regulatory sensor-transducer, BlaR1/MecR1 family [Sphingopyxis sp. C-1]